MHRHHPIPRSAGATAAPGPRRAPVLRPPAAGRIARTVLVVLTALACAPAVDPELEPSAERPVRARATVDREVVTIGDRVRLTLEVVRPDQAAVELPAPPERFGALRVHSSESAPDPQRVRGGTLERQTWTLVADRVGSHRIPAFEIAYSLDGEQGSVSTGEIEVTVESVLAADAGEGADIRDVKPLRRHRREIPAAALALAGLVALAVLAGWWWWRRRRRRTAGGGRPALPPYEEAMLAIERLRRTDFGDPERVRLCYFELSEAVRRYVERRFDLNATDLTSEEICARLGAVGGLPAGEAARLEHFLLATDRVKFARRIPSSREIAETFDLAVAFVEATRPAEGPEQGGQSGEGGGDDPRLPIDAEPAPARPSSPAAAEGRG